MDIDKILSTAADVMTRVGLKVLGAIAIFVVGRWLIRFAVRVLQRALRSRHIDDTVGTYVGNALAVVLNVALVVAILGYFGVETTTFAALIAAAGIAIGMAWSGLLSNFAAGAFLIILRPIKVGDFVSAGDVMGTVEEIGLFVTTINTMDNVKTFVGNGKVLGGNIQNFSANPYRRVDLVAQLNHGVDHQEAVALLKARVAAIPNVIGDPAPVVVILEFNLAGPVLAVRPHCHTDHYWQVYFDTNEAIRTEFGKAGFPVPEQHLRVAQP